MTVGGRVVKGGESRATRDAPKRLPSATCTDKTAQVFNADSTFRIFRARTRVSSVSTSYH